MEIPRVQRTRTWDSASPSQNNTHKNNSSSGGHSGPQQLFVLYTLVGEEVEPIDETKPNRIPDTNWNAFVLHPPPDTSGIVRLGDIQRAFPLGTAYHFSFRCDNGLFVDLTNPKAEVPFCERKIIARVTPLVEAPGVEYVTPIAYKNHTADGYHDRRLHDPEEYMEFESEYESHDEKPTAAYNQRDWNSSNNSHQDELSRNSLHDDRPHRGDRYDYDGNRASVTNRSSEWVEAGKDAQAFLRKQTEQAYDFAKKISIEDAKKGASETAKKAKKWGGSLLSSITATISNAASVAKNETIQVGGITLSVVRPIAEGAYAQVLLVRSVATNETFALKRIICQSQEVESDVQTELQVFQSVKHLNIMPLVEFAQARQQNLEFYFLTPYFERGTLWDAIQSACNSSSPLWPFTQRAALHLFHGICSGVLALHRAGFCHRDLKPHNILLSSSSSGEDFLAYIPVITDFGSCSPIRVEVRSRRSSLDIQDEANRKSSAPYRAPELFEPIVDGVVDGQSDVWSLGCILYAMAFGTSPFEHPREGFMKLACMNGRVTFPPEQGGVVRHRGTQFTHEFCDFIRDMLHTNPEERPSVLDTLEFTEELINDEMKR